MSALRCSVGLLKAFCAASLLICTVSSFGGTAQDWLGAAVQWLSNSQDGLVACAWDPVEAEDAEVLER